MRFRIVTIVLLSFLYIKGHGQTCPGHCLCCKTDKCGMIDGIDNYCVDGCREAYWGYRCLNICRGNCFNCSRTDGSKCNSCWRTFYDPSTSCSKICSPGCMSRFCDDDGKCKCIDNYEGDKCDKCIAGKYGDSCSLNCNHSNCRCNAKYGCDSCKPGFYGNNTLCVSRCSNGCFINTCDNEGRCNCKLQFSGEMCAYCIGGFFGEHCNETCLNICSERSCSRDGTCICGQNFEGKKCDRCIVDRYGEKCEHKCSPGCATPTCDAKTGFCPCKTNFQGEKCNECIEGLYGEYCNQTCAVNCLQETCLRSTGVCTAGCKDGFTSDKCSEPCNSQCKACQQNNGSICESCFEDHWGTACRCPINCYCASGSKECLNCRNGYISTDLKCICRKEYCADTSCNSCKGERYFSYKNACCECSNHCKDGKCISHSQCLDGCQDGYFGEDCLGKCIEIDTHCLRCHKNIRSCTLCENSYYISSNETCTPCSSNCVDFKCKQRSGNCTEGCNLGLWNYTCDIPCLGNCDSCDQLSGLCIMCNQGFKYGPYCNISCSTKCKNRTCNQRNGECMEGCFEGYTGSFCEKVKGQEQISVTIPNVTSTIVGTVGGFVFGILLMLAVIWILKQRSNLFNNRTVHRKMSGDSGHGNNPSKTLKPETSYSSLCIADEPSYSYQILSEAQMEKDDGNQEYETMKHANSSQNTGTEVIQAYETMKRTNSSKNTEETKEDETMKHTNSSKNTEETQEYETMKRTNSSNNTDTETKSKDLTCA